MWGQVSALVLALDESDPVAIGAKNNKRVGSRSRSDAFNQHNHLRLVPSPFLYRFRNHNHIRGAEAGAGVGTGSVCTSSFSFYDSRISSFSSYTLSSNPNLREDIESSRQARRERSCEL